MGEFSPWHLLIVAIVFVVLFGSKRLPDAARSLGRSMRILKAETAGLRGDQDNPADPPSQPARTQVLTAAPAGGSGTATATSPAFSPAPQTAVSGPV